MRSKSNLGAFSWGVAITLVIVVGIPASVAIQAFMKYQKKTKTAEAVTNVRRIHDAEIAYYNDHTSKADAEICETSARYSPPRCCARKTATFVDAPSTLKRPHSNPQVGNWDHPGWRALGFKPSGPTRYSYSAVASGIGLDAAFTARATGDLDDDGNTSLFEREGSMRLFCEPGWGNGATLYTVQDIE